MNKSKQDKIDELFEQTAAKFESDIEKGRLIVKNADIRTDHGGLIVICDTPVPFSALEKGDKYITITTDQNKTITGLIGVKGKMRPIPMFTSTNASIIFGNEYTEEVSSNNGPIPMIYNGEIC